MTKESKSNIKKLVASFYTFENISKNIIFVVFKNIVNKESI